MLSPGHLSSCKEATNKTKQNRTKQNKPTNQPNSNQTNNQTIKQPNDQQINSQKTKQPNIQPTNQQNKFNKPHQTKTNQTRTKQEKKQTKQINHPPTQTNRQPDKQNKLQTTMKTKPSNLSYGCKKINLPDTNETKRTLNLDGVIINFVRKQLDETLWVWTCWSRIGNDLKFWLAKINFLFEEYQLFGFSRRAREWFYSALQRWDMQNLKKITYWRVPSRVSPSIQKKKRRTDAALHGFRYNSCIRCALVFVAYWLVILLCTCLAALSVSLPKKKKKDDDTHKWETSGE